MRRFLSLLPLLGLAVCMIGLENGVLPCFATESVLLAKGGKPRVYIKTDSSIDRVTQLAIEELTVYLRRICGAVISTEPGADLIPLHVGEPSEFSDLGFSVPEIAREGFLFKATPKAIYLLGGSSLGTQHAVYTLLRDLGCRWIMPGEIGECIPANLEPALAVGERIEEPDFEYRIVWYAYGSSPEAAARYDDWLRRNRMGKPSVMHGHNLTQTLARKVTFEQHPEYYSLVSGKRTQQQICTSNPEVVRLVIESIREYLDKYPDTVSYSLCPDDNTDFCECEHCKALDVGHMDRGGLPSISDRYQVFLNQVLEGLEKTHPGARVTTYSYNRNHTDPPQKTKVHPNTTVFITSSAFCSAHGIGDEFCESRQDFRKLITEWTHHTKHLVIYEYDPVPYSGALPWPMWDAHIREMKIYKELGIDGVSAEGQNSWAAYFPNYYIAGQLMWDAEQDGGELWADMLDSFFGESSEAMRGYYSALASVIGSFKPKVEWGLIQYPELFPTGVVEQAEESLSRAESLAKSEMVRKRLEMVRLSFEEMKAYLKVRDPKRTGGFPEYKASVEKMRESIDKLASINEDYILAKIAHEKTGKAVGENYGREFGYINSWQLCGPFENIGMEGHDTPYPPETNLDLSSRHTGKGGVEALWKLSSSPEWRAFVDLRAEYEQKDNVCAYALCWVTIPDGPKQVEFRMGSNDSIKAFLNGKEIWNNKVQRVGAPDEDRTTVTLPEGTSTVLLKICQTGLNWGFYFRIMEPGKEEPLAGLKASPYPPK
ncbi:MAG: DUF4838 domain-containing protein [Candidatus Omnitrophica bacterium]|nr:DUF4838 domain-containing protein [Candidatus Omnitrophota bacterium]